MDNKTCAWYGGLLGAFYRQSQNLGGSVTTTSTTPQPEPIPSTSSPLSDSESATSDTSSENDYPFSFPLHVDDMEEDTNTASPGSGSTISSSTKATTIPDTHDSKTLPDLHYRLPIDLKDPHPQHNVQMIHYQDDTVLRLCPQQVTKTPRNEHTIKEEHVSDPVKTTCDGKYLFIEGIYGFAKHKLPLTKKSESKKKDNVR